MPNIEEIMSKISTINGITDTQLAEIRKIITEKTVDDDWPKVYEKPKWPKPTPKPEWENSKNQEYKGMK